MRRFFSIPIMCVAAWLLAGCNVARITLNEPLTSRDVGFIVRGETTLSQVVDQLGAPDQLHGTGTGLAAMYHFLDLKYSRVNFGYLLKPWSPVTPDLVMSGSGVGTDALEIVFDSRWTVRDYAFTHHVTGSRFNPWPF